MSKQINWGMLSWTRGWECAEVKSLRELAAKGGRDLEHSINYLLNLGTDQAEVLAEELFEQFA
jgi:hypothetical protein